MTGSYLQLQQLRKAFANTPVVNDVSLDMARGDFICILGASGCGKTTLLRLIAGLEQPDAGTIVLEGKDITAMSPHQRPVNMVFQSYALFPHMTVAENIGFGLRQERIADAQIRHRVAHIMQRLQIEGLEQRKPDQLSGGQQQRVALARALIKQPKILLLDEPMAALDKQLREATQFELQRIQHELGITFVMVTHDQTEAMSLASRIAVMIDGRIVQFDTPQKIYEQPVSRQVAEFVGSVNLFAGKVTRSQSPIIHVHCDALAMTLQMHSELLIAVGENVTVAVRPEQLRLISDGVKPMQNAFAAQVMQLSYRGDMTLIQLRTMAGQLVKMQCASSHVAQCALQAGKTVQLGFAANDAWVMTC